MPTDTRRLPVPENSTPPCVFSSVLSTDIVKPVLTDDKKRLDGRLPNQHRSIFASVGIITQARGSAYIEMGQTKVICAFYGPRETKFRDEFSLLGQITCELKFATFSSAKRGQHQQSTAEKEAGMIVKEALAPAVQLDKFPKAKIEVFIIVLEDDGSALAAAISCASLALSDGGIEMFDLPVGLSLRRYGDVTLIDPNKQEESTLEETSDGLTDYTACQLTVGYLPSLNQISAISQTGLLNVDTSQLCMKEAVDACRDVHAVLKKWLLSTTGRRLAAKRRQLGDKPGDSQHVVHVHTTQTC